MKEENICRWYIKINCLWMTEMFCNIVAGFHHGSTHRSPANYNARDSWLSSCCCCYYDDGDIVVTITTTNKFHWCQHIVSNSIWCHKSMHSSSCIHQYLTRSTQKFSRMSGEILFSRKTYYETSFFKVEAPELT